MTSPRYIQKTIPRTSDSLKRTHEIYSSLFFFLLTQIQWSRFSRSVLITCTMPRATTLPQARHSRLLYPDAHRLLSPTRRRPPLPHATTATSSLAARTTTPPAPPHGRPRPAGASPRDESVCRSHQRRVPRHVPPCQDPCRPKGKHRGGWVPP